MALTPQQLNAWALFGGTISLGLLELFLVHRAHRVLAWLAFVPAGARTVALTAAQRAALTTRTETGQGYRSGAAPLDLARMRTGLDFRPHWHVAASGRTITTTIDVPSGRSSYAAVARIRVSERDGGLLLRAYALPRFIVPLLGFFGILIAMARDNAEVRAIFVALAAFLSSALTLATRVAHREAAGRALDSAVPEPSDSARAREATLDARRR